MQDTKEPCRRRCGGTYQALSVFRGLGMHDRVAVCSVCGDFKVLTVEVA